MIISVLLEKRRSIKGRTRMVTKLKVLYSCRGDLWPRGQDQVGGEKIPKCHSGGIKEIKVKLIETKNFSH